MKLGEKYVAASFTTLSKCVIMTRLYFSCFTTRYSVALGDDLLNHNISTIAKLNSTC